MWRNQLKTRSFDFLKLNRITYQKRSLRCKGHSAWNWVAGDKVLPAKRQSAGMTSMIELQYFRSLWDHSGSKGFCNQETARNALEPCRPHAETWGADGPELAVAYLRCCWREEALVHPVANTCTTCMASWHLTKYWDERNQQKTKVWNTPPPTATKSEKISLSLSMYVIN